MRVRSVVHAIHGTSSPRLSARPTSVPMFYEEEFGVPFSPAATWSVVAGTHRQLPLLRTGKCLHLRREGHKQIICGDVQVKNGMPRPG